MQCDVFKSSSSWVLRLCMTAILNYSVEMSWLCLCFPFVNPMRLCTIAFVCGVRCSTWKSKTQSLFRSSDPFLHCLFLVYLSSHRLEIEGRAPNQVDADNKVLVILLLSFICGALAFLKVLAGVLASFCRTSNSISVCRSSTSWILFWSSTI